MRSTPAPSTRPDAWGVDDRKGKICAGYDADLVVLEDNYDVAQTYCRGKKML